MASRPPIDEAKCRAVTMRGVQCTRYPEETEGLFPNTRCKQHKDQNTFRDYDPDVAPDVGPGDSFNDAATDVSMRSNPYLDVQTEPAIRRYMFPTTDASTDVSAGSPDPSSMFHFTHGNSGPRPPQPNNAYPARQDNYPAQPQRSNDDLYSSEPAQGASGRQHSGVQAQPDMTARPRMTSRVAVEEIRLATPPLVGERMARRSRTRSALASEVTNLLPQR